MAPFYALLSLALPAAIAAQGHPHGPPPSSSGQPSYEGPRSYSVESAISSSSSAAAVASSSSPPTATSTASPTFSSAVLKACAASMDGQLPASTPSDFHFSGNVRRYYVSAEEIEWNYAPTGWDNWLGVPINISPRAQRVTQYNTTFLKALYRGYTDGSFSTLTEQGAWQGTQGPTLRSEVGDMIEIMFVNNLTQNYATMHSMGLEYSKMNEGADYPNGTTPGVNYTLPLGSAVPPVDAGVSPGNCVVYKWLVDELSGPNDGEPARVHSYHSYVDLDVDSNSGLIGPQMVYAPGKMNDTMSRYREFPLLYMIYNEAHSFLSNRNAAKLYGNHSTDPQGEFGPLETPGGSALDTETLYSGNYSIWHPQIVNLASSGHFPAAPSFHSMNGYIFSNNPPYEMCQDDNVIWYLNAYGAASHVFHMHGNSFQDAGRKQYAVSLNDGVGKTAYMNATGVGLWQVICHVSNHHQEGMVSDYRVWPAGQCPLKPLVK